MASEIHYREQYPYYAVTLLQVTFPDGTTITGTGSVVGRNDILTATHVIYSADNGGWATSVAIYAGADYNGRLGRFDHQGHLDLGSYSYTIDAWPDQVYADRPYDLLGNAESQYDVALIGLSEPIGDLLGGWFGLASGYDHGVWASQLGYPREGTGMMLGEAWVTSHSQYGVYEANLGSGSDILGPGSSGGPLYVYEDGLPYIIGVKSAGSDTVSVWADIGFLYDQLVRLIAENDSLLADGGAPSPPPPTPGYEQVFYNSPGNDHFMGGWGLDAVVYHDWSFNYHITIDAGVTDVRQLTAPYAYDFHGLVERLIFDDGIMAVDVGPWENAGSTYRLYQAAFGRTPDQGGLKYWIDQMDHGHGLATLAHGFVASAEFRDLYGHDPTAEELVHRYYVNVLDRPPEPGGYDYWLGQYESGEVDAAEMLVRFSEGPENLERVGHVINDGIWLG
ncbi:MAG: DUF4214 domain-containing protein [Pigmentiphaga sp.]|nr:DUF4214 domain-containing protein [Pigmentiphaga sp.]